MKKSTCVCVHVHVHQRRSINHTRVGYRRRRLRVTRCRASSHSSPVVILDRLFVDNDSLISRFSFSGPLVGHCRSTKVEKDNTTPGNDAVSFSFSPGCTRWRNRVALLRGRENVRYWKRSRRRRTNEEMTRGFAFSFYEDSFYVNRDTPLPVFLLRTSKRNTKQRKKVYIYEIYNIFCHCVDGKKKPKKKEKEIKKNLNRKDE